jgi:hypothetical protein
MPKCASEGESWIGRRTIVPNLSASPGGLVHLDILLEAFYLHLECLLKKFTNRSARSKAGWMC